KIPNPNENIGAGNVAATTQETEFAYPIGECAIPIINHGFKLLLNSGGHPCRYRGPISGTGRVEVYAGSPNAPLVIDGLGSNTIRGTWSIKIGRVVLAKEPGMDTMAGTIFVGGSNRSAELVWNASDQINDAAEVQLLRPSQGDASLQLNGFTETISRLTLAAGTRVLTDGPAGGGVLTVRELTVDGRSMPKGVYTSSSGWLHGRGYVIVGDVKRVEVAGLVDDPNQAIGAGNIAV